MHVCSGTDEAAMHVHVYMLCTCARYTPSPCMYMPALEHSGAPQTWQVCNGTDEATVRVHVGCVCVHDAFYP